MESKCGENQCKGKRVSHSQTEPCLRDALADAFNAAVGSTPDKIRSPGAFLCTVHAQQWSGLICLPESLSILNEKTRRERGTGNALFLFLLPQLGTIHKRRKLKRVNVPH